MSLSTFDHSKMSRQLGHLHDALIGAGQHGDARNLIRDESRRLLQQILKFTPPKNQAQGRAAVSRDIQRAIPPLTADTIHDPKLRAQVNKLAEAHDVEGLRKLFSKLPKLKSWHIVDVDPRIHKMNRDRRGRVQSSRRNYTLDIRGLAKYIREVQKRVGFMRAPWGKAFVAVGGKIADWVSRHFSYARGYVQANLTHPTFPSLTVSNQTPGIGQWEARVKAALQARHQAIGKRIRLILSGYSKDVARGIRPHRRVTQTAGTTAE